MAGLKAKATAEGRTFVWVDETGLYLLPAVRRTWAPRGQTPVLRAPFSRDHLSVIGALTQEGRVLTRTYPHAVSGTEVVRFLRHLLQHLAGPLLVLWDGASIHHGQAVKDFLATDTAKRLQLERLPAYAPDLNPADGLWHLLKHHELGNLVCEALWELKLELRQAFARLRHRTHALRGCIAQAGYSL